MKEIFDKDQEKFVKFEEDRKPEITINIDWLNKRQKRKFRKRKRKRKQIIWHSKADRHFFYLKILF